MISAYDEDIVSGIKSKPCSPKMRKSHQLRSSMTNSFGSTINK